MTLRAGARRSGRIIAAAIAFGAAFLGVAALTPLMPSGVSADEEGADTATLDERVLVALGPEPSDVGYADFSKARPGLYGPYEVFDAREGGTVIAWWFDLVGPARVGEDRTAEAVAAEKANIEVATTPPLEVDR